MAALTAAQRQAARRKRQSMGLGIIPVPVNVESVSAMLCDKGLLDAQDVDCPKRVGAAFAEWYRLFVTYEK